MLDDADKPGHATADAVGTASPVARSGVDFPPQGDRTAADRAVAKDAVADHPVTDHPITDHTAVDGAAGNGAGHAADADPPVVAEVVPAAEAEARVIAENRAAAEISGEVVDPMRELRSLLMGPEQREVANLRRRLDELKLRPPQVGDVLADAVKSRPQPDAPLAKALSPIIQGAFTASIQNDKQAIADAISPIMGPAIRKSISDALARMVQSLSQTLDYSFSPRSVGWRIEAARTHKSFAEVVILKTLKFRVEQVLLVHRKTGLLLQHLISPGAATQDGDMVSGMMSAIQDFARDSFGKPGDALDQLRIGERDIWIEQGPLTILAAVVIGSPPQQLRTTMKEAQESIDVEMGPELEEFSGDAAVFEKARPALETCLQEGKADDDAGTTKKKKPFLAYWVLGILLLLIGLWIFFSVRASARRTAADTRSRQLDQQWSDYLNRLSGTPGIIPLASAKKDGKYVVEGLRDVHAVDPLWVLAGTHPVKPGPVLDALMVDETWKPYVSADFAEAWARDMLDPPPGVELKLIDGALHLSGLAPRSWIATAPALAHVVPGVKTVVSDKLSPSDLPPPPPVIPTLARAVVMMAPPPTVRLTFDNAAGALTASGGADRAWIEAARQIAPFVPGVMKYDDSRVTNLSASRARQARAQIESRAISFVSEAPDIEPGQDLALKDVADAIGDLARSAGTGFAVEIVGHASPTGGDEYRARLALARASKVKDALAAQGVNPAFLTVAKEDTPAGETRSFRNATFRVVFTNAEPETLHPRQDRPRDEAPHP